MSVVTNLEKLSPRERIGTGRTLLLSSRPDEFGSLDAGLRAMGRLTTNCTVDSVSATAMIQSGAFDLVIADLGAEPEGLLRTLETLRRDPWLQDVVFVALVADAAEPLARRALALGIDEILREPIDPDLARLRLHNSLERRRLRNEVMSYWVANAADDGADHAAAALRALPEPVIILLPDSTVELANEAAARLFGVSTSALIGSALSAMLSRAFDPTQSGPITVGALLAQPGPSMFMARCKDGSHRPVSVTATNYERFGQRMCACLMRETDWTNAQVGTSLEPTGPRVTAEIWGVLADQSLRRLEEASRHLTVMRDQVFGPIGTAIYQSYLSDALSSLSQVRHLLDRGTGSEGREAMRAAVPLAEVAEEARLACATAADIRQIACDLETAHLDMALRVPREKMLALLRAMYQFSIEAAEAGGRVALRTQIVSEQRLLLMMVADGTSISTADLARMCVSRPTPETVDHPLTIAWNNARAASRALGAKLELNQDQPKGGFIVMAFLPQRREGDPA